MATVLDPILNSPRFPHYLRQLQEAFKVEQRKREHFYQTITDEDKAEFINGEIVFHSPVKMQHDRVSQLLATLMGSYVRSRQSGYVGHEKLLISLSRNDYEPDVCFFNVEKARLFTRHQMRFPAPDLAVEILSESTEARDRGIKFEDYAAHGVTEYWIVDPEAETVEQYLLEEGQYKLAVKVKDALLRSPTIPGFAIPARAIFDETQNLQTLRQLLEQV
ncbi:MAG: Uma2 family endonuclease [Ardenticatenales bacterium]|nr:Uma2 family endonuclease [Ardenticatenales bacterium]